MRRRIAAVVTDRGTVETGAVVCAAGAWSAAIGEMAGVPLPVTPVRRQILLHRAHPQPARTHSDDDRLRHRLLLSPRGQRPPDGYGRSQRDARVQARHHRGLDPGAAGGRRAASAGDHRGRHRRRLGGAVRGLSRPQRDRRARRAVPARFLYATGFSGHGFLQGPAIGEIVRDLYLGREPFVDVTPLSADAVRRAASPAQSGTWCERCDRCRRSCGGGCRMPAAIDALDAALTAAPRRARARSHDRSRPATARCW